MKTQATLKAVRISPRKAGEVAALIRGRSVEDALVILDHTPRKAAQIFSKLLKSVSANAENNHDMNADALTIEKLTVNRAPSPKRYRPAAHGRALPYRLHHSHLNVIVSDDGAKSKPAEKKESEAKQDATDAKKTTKASTTKKSTPSTKSTQTASKNKSPTAKKPATKKPAPKSTKQSAPQTAKKPATTKKRGER